MVIDLEPNTCKEATPTTIIGTNSTACGRKVFSGFTNAATHCPGVACALFAVPHLRSDWVASFPIGTVFSEQIISHLLPVLLPSSSHIKSFPTAVCSRLPGFPLHCHTHRQGCCPALCDASGVLFQSYSLCLKIYFVRWSCRKGLCECSYHLLCCCSFIWAGCSLWKGCWDCINLLKARFKSACCTSSLSSQLHKWEKYIFPINFWVLLFTIINILLTINCICFLNFFLKEPRHLFP